MKMNRLVITFIDHIKYAGMIVLALVTMFWILGFPLGIWTIILLTVGLVGYFFSKYQEETFFQGKDKYYTLFADPIKKRNGEDEDNFIVFEPAEFGPVPPRYIWAGEVSVETKFGEKFEVSLELGNAVVDITGKWEGKASSQVAAIRKHFLIEDTIEKRAEIINPMITNLIIICITTKLLDQDWKEVSKDLKKIQSSLRGMTKRKSSIIGKQCETYGIEIPSFSLGDIVLSADLKKSINTVAVAEQLDIAIGKLMANKRGLTAEDAGRFLLIVSDEVQGFDVRGLEKLQGFLGDPREIFNPSNKKGGK